MRSQTSRKTQWKRLRHETRCLIGRLHCNGWYCRARGPHSETFQKTLLAKRERSKLTTFYSTFYWSCKLRQAKNKNENKLLIGRRQVWIYSTVGSSQLVVASPKVSAGPLDPGFAVSGRFFPESAPQILLKRVEINAVQQAAFQSTSSLSGNTLAMIFPTTFAYILSMENNIHFEALFISALTLSATPPDEWFEFSTTACSALPKSTFALHN